ncbi:unnamed protein product [Linum trigynum]|uniref:Uncharacterized protein n=1 Tax=Linum trigynum TaxID=586398 RepID=A0AAV2FAS4_9ROSI
MSIGFGFWTSDSFSSKGRYKKWKLRDFLLFRSASEGRATRAEQLSAAAKYAVLSRRSRRLLRRRSRRVAACRGGLEEEESRVAACRVSTSKQSWCFEFAIPRGGRGLRLRGGEWRRGVNHSIS